MEAEEHNSTVRFSIRNFEIVEPCTLDHPRINSINSFTVDGVEYKHGLKNQFVYGLGHQKHNNLQVIVSSADGLPWKHGCLYLMDKTFHGDVDLTTVKTQAIALAQFKNYCDEKEIDYLEIPRNKRRKPLYRYYQHLKALQTSGEIAASTASRKIRAAVSFYRYLLDDMHVNFAYPPFAEKLVFIDISSGGKPKHKPVVTTDVAIKVPKPLQLPSEFHFIEDGGKLRPLEYIEQELLFKTLCNLGNTEMTLLFWLAANAGGREQTCLTVRHEHARMRPSSPGLPIVIPTGPGTLIDAKGDKKSTLYIPTDLQEQLETYSRSPRAQKRLNKYCLKNNIDPLDEDALGDVYLFLTNQGNPYYSSRADNRRYNPNNERASSRDGGKVRAFLKDRVLPVMKKKFGPEYWFRFHDLRATFGMNLVDSYKPMVDAGKMDYTEMLNLVRIRMAHEHASTTEGYLGYRDKVQILSKVQRTFENRVLRLIELGLGMDQE